jgi:HEAT repeat protein
MDLVDAAVKQAAVLRAYAAFGSRDAAERYRAMCQMRECGPAGIWCLQLALRRSAKPRVQCAAAVVLHWLGDARGLMTLTEALKWRLPTEPLRASELESAFVTIGSPDAVTALLTVWNMLPDWGESEPVRASICRVWAALRNPVVLPALASGALLIPDRFEQTVPAFGEMAIPVLGDLSRSRDSRHRVLAVQTLRHIGGRSSFDALRPMLRDPDMSVRALVPAAMMRTGCGETAIEEIALAATEGFPSREALAALLRSRPANLRQILVEMLERWRPGSIDETDADIVLTALPVLRQAEGDDDRALGALCDIINCRIEPSVTVATIQAIESLALRTGGLHQRVMECLRDHAAAPCAAVREQAAMSLARLGDTLPARVIDFVNECRPQEGLLDQLQVILRGGHDAGFAATQAVQQVSKWWARLTTVPGSPTGAPSGDNLQPTDPRLPATLCWMLAGARQNSDSCTARDAEERAEFIAMLLRALVRLGMPAAAVAWSEIVAILHTRVDGTETGAASQPRKDRAAVGAAAAEAVMALYGPNSFGIFLEALYSPNANVIQTGINALSLLGDRRALPHLRAISAIESHPCSAGAERAVAQIRRTNPEMMTLLRGSVGEAADPASLLRAARGDNGVGSPDLLLRAATQEPE